MKLIVLKNNVPINEVQVDTPDSSERYEIFVGRADDCHVLIDDPLISRHHFVIKNEGHDWFSQKLTQLGVVLVNGSVAPVNKLNVGDEIKCGAYSILIADLPVALAAVPTPAPVEAAPVVAQPEPEPEPEPPPAEEALASDSAEAVDGPVTEEGFEDSAQEEATEEESSDFGDSPFGDDDNQSLDGESEAGGLDNAFGDDSLPSADFGGDDSSSLAAFPNDGDMEEQDEGTRVFQAFVNYQLVLMGEHAPYDRYQIDSEEVFIGRDPKKCQIILNDPEVSSVHAVLRRNLSLVSLEDLNSSNGTILNGERINKADLNTGDDFVIGSTTFTLEVKSDLLDAEGDRLMPVESGQIIETEEIEEEEISMDDAEEINFGGEAPVEKSALKRMWKDPKQRKKLIYGVAGLALMWVLLGEEEPQDVPVEKKQVVKEAKPEEKKIQLSKELENKRNVAYELGVSFFEQQKLFEALREFQTVVEIDPEYKKVQSYLEQTKIGLKQLEELEAQKRAEEERIKLKKQIEELLVKAREAVKNRQVTVAENYFSQIVEKDPENIEVSQLKLEIESWQKEEERKALEKALKEKARKTMVDALTPGKTFYLKREWYRAILKLEEYLRRQGTDEDLVKEASDMLADAKNQLASELGPLLGKARSLKEGQDFKSAYEAYLEVLKVEPTNAEALNEVADIKFQLESRSKRVYREAIISESLSLFTDAKEKFQEVQQISPTDSEYYQKASDKLKDYLE